VSIISYPVSGVDTGHVKVVEKYSKEIVKKSGKLSTKSEKVGTFG